MSSVSATSPADSGSGPPRSKRARCSNACQRCKAKKLKCNRTLEAPTCQACIKARVSCIVDPERYNHLSSCERSTLERKIRDLEARLALQETSSGALPQTGFDVTWLVDETTGASPINLRPPPPAIGDALFHLVHIHMRSRYPFLDWDTLRQWYTDREDICVVGGTRRIEAYFVWMISAIAAQLAPQTSSVSSSSYFAAAWGHIHAVLNKGGLTSAEGLLLAVFYSFRSQQGLSYWSLGGHAMRTCIELNLHRAAEGQGQSLQECERRKGIFWTAYSFDRLISLAQDKPFSISDGDIDVDLPLDIEDVSEYRLSLSKPTTSLSSSIHSVKLYRIMSRVHTTFYSVHAPVPTVEATVSFLAELSQWKQDIPRVTHHGIGIPLEAFEIRYLRCVLYTLRPSILDAEPSDTRVVLCASAAAEACELGRTVHQQPLSQQSSVTPRHAFISGVTLLHCISLNPNVIPQRVSSRAVRACSTTLAVLAQHFPQGRKLSELFEHLADETLCGDGSTSSRETLRSLLRDRAPRPVSITADVSQKVSTPITDPFAGPSGLTPFLHAESPPTLDFGVQGINEIEGWIDWSDVNWIT